MTDVPLPAAGARVRFAKLSARAISIYERMKNSLTTACECYTINFPFEKFNSCGRKKKRKIPGYCYPRMNWWGLINHANCGEQYFFSRNWLFKVFLFTSVRILERGIHYSSDKSILWIILWKKKRNRYSQYRETLYVEAPISNTM